MIYLQLSAITKAFNTVPLLKGIDLSLVKGDRVGLVGPNGIGKTTILKIALGDVLADSGTAIVNKEIKVGYVSQEDEIVSDYSLFLAMIESYQELLQVGDQMQELESQLENAPEELLDAYGKLQSKWEHLGGYTYESDIKRLLIGLGFAEADLRRPVSTLSGGERNRAALAKILLHSPDLLLLDEPTNHLDIESTIWLENYLKVFNGALIVVSHDRIFLDNVVTKIVELENGKLQMYHGNFTKYCEERAERRRLQLKKYLHQKEEIDRIEDFIRKNIVGQKHRQAQSRRKNLAKIDRLTTPNADKQKMAVNLSVSRRSYQSVAVADNLSFGWDYDLLLHKISFKIERGDRVGLIGRNGIGKSTLVKLLMGELEAVDGSIKIGNNVDAYYFDQELRDLDPRLSVIDTIWDIHPEWDAYQLRSYLARFLFFGDDVFKIVGDLSGGEKKKLAIARMLTIPANFLILDEPTNHLDISSREVLEESLRDYQGAVLVVSHDRYFLDAIANRIFAIVNGQFRETSGNYNDYLRRFEKIDQQQPQQQKEKKRKNYKYEKRVKNVISAKRKRIKELEELIPLQEKLISEIEVEIKNDVNADDWQILHDLIEKKKEERMQLDQLTLEYYKLLEEDETTDI